MATPDLAVWAAPSAWPWPLATFGTIFLTEAVLSGVHPTASAIALRLWLIVADLLACAVASLVMVRAQPATAVIGPEGETREVGVARLGS